MMNRLEWIKSLMIEYLVASQETVLPIQAVSTGASILMHVFTLLVECPNVYYQCQKAYYYYLEYLDQVGKSNLSHKLGYANACIFVYEKIFADISGNEMGVVCPTVSDSMDFIHLGNSVKTFLFWNHPTMTTANRIRLCEQTMVPFLQTSIDHPVFLENIETIQETSGLAMTCEEYETYLREKSLPFYRVPS